AVIAIAVRTGWYIELVLLVARIWLRFAKIPGEARSANQRTADAVLLAIFNCQYADAAKPIHPDRILGQQLMILVQFRFKVFAKRAHLLLEAFIELVLQAADAESMRGKARSAVILEYL